ncbi:MAG: hypothetical protein A3F72_03115 [Bacteroidetes bacterium RIFCSPLOWO2_12_FULL_35_15]|nr:MAG: hypothetical protein A3F72_03115 [Bacteroidetes bacterium RIFCSPLOWO2_12_FULL_35_15]
MTKIKEIIEKPHFETKLKEKYMLLSRIDAPIIKKKVMDECGVNSTVFFNWCQGITPVPKLCRAVLCEIFAEPEYILFKEQLEKKK